LFVICLFVLFNFQTYQKLNNKTNIHTVTNNLTMSDTIFPPSPPTAQEFEYLPNSSRIYVKDAYDVITRKELWRPFREALLSRGVEPNTGFMFTDDPLYKKIQHSIASTEIGGGHTGFTMGYVMREMEFIALHGEPAYKEMYTRSR